MSNQEAAKLLIELYAEYRAKVMVSSRYAEAVAIAIRALTLQEEATDHE